MRYEKWHALCDLSSTGWDRSVVTQFDAKKIGRSLARIPDRINPVMPPLRGSIYIGAMPFYTDGALSGLSIPGKGGSRQANVNW